MQKFSWASRALFSSMWIWKLYFKISIRAAIKVLSEGRKTSLLAAKVLPFQRKSGAFFLLQKPDFPQVEEERRRQSCEHKSRRREVRVCAWANKYLHRILGIRLEACDVERLHVAADHVKPHGLVQQILALNILAFKLDAWWGCGGFLFSPRLWFPARARGSPW